MHFPANSEDGAQCLGAEALSLSKSRQDRGALTVADQVVALFDQLHRPLHKYLLFFGLAEEEADDVVQETFIKLYEWMQRSSVPAHPRAWVFRVAENLAVSRQRKGKFLVDVDPEELLRIYETRNAPAPSPEELLLERERTIRVHGIITSLTVLQQQCLQLRVEGFRYREIAEILGISASTVNDALRRVVKKLARDTGERWD